MDTDVIKFIAERSYPSDFRLKMETHNVSLPDILQDFQYFLKGMGFVFNGNIVIEEDFGNVTDNENNYGKEVILDIHGCSVQFFTEEIIDNFFKQLCDLIDMERVKTHFWVDHESDEEHLYGISAIQFIKTSNITIHVIEKMKRVYLNIFSCKDFDTTAAIDFCLEFFGGKIKNEQVVTRY